MYTISIYFDEKTNKIIQNHINRVAEQTGNTFMLDGNVPPHITVSLFETKQVAKVMEALEKAVKEIKTGRIQWVGVGMFFPYVIYLTPVLDEYLHSVGQAMHGCLENIEETKISPYYRPFQWLPHATIGKTLSQEQMRKAFEVLQKNFGVFEGTVTAIGLAKTNPHQDIKVWNLKS